MSYELFRESFPTAKKEHKCELCGEAVQKGTRYRVRIGTFDGDFFTEKLHLECAGVLDDFVNDQDLIDLESGYDYSNVGDWWRSVKCEKCKKRFDICEQLGECELYTKGGPESCEKYIRGGFCQRKRCSLMDKNCWCTQYDRARSEK
ncbi:MAG: hypothetical protein LBN00_06375 [Oscillospiraceae bacterium]|jgi:hypothetical protein|nr:hypothetical protein [Oscillospiraceae bacterium]